MQLSEAKNILSNIIDPGQMAALNLKGTSFAPEMSSVPFTEETLRENGGTHILIYAPRTYADGKPVTLNSLRDIFGTNSSFNEPCFYNQDWYLKEDFANTSLDGKWHVIRKEVLEGARAKEPEEIQKSLIDEKFPSAVLSTFTFFVWWLLRKDVLWRHDFLWCSDRDHNGDRIYVGRYEDPTDMNKNGFNIHRHLSLRSAYSAAPEIIR